MNLTLETTLDGIAHVLETRIVEREAARLAVMLTKIAALAIDDAAAIRADENERMRTLFADAAACVDEAMAVTLREAAAVIDQSIRISDLDRENARLRRVLIALHGVVESRIDPPARAIDARIWRLLCDIETARAPGV